MLRIGKHVVLVFSFRHSPGKPGYIAQWPMQVPFAKQVTRIRVSGSRIKVGSGAALETLE